MSDTYSEHHLFNAPRMKDEGVDYIECPYCDGTGEIHSHNPNCRCRPTGWMKLEDYRDGLAQQELNKQRSALVDEFRSLAYRSTLAQLESAVMLLRAKEVVRKSV
ncbi:MAG: hypothetical protein JSS66_07655 [Armatimonadetes bacterium]|nr:hypothetical protein [Armatimonadota bacterium]